MSKSWCPLFSSIVDSSLWREPDYVVKIFLTMMAKKDHNHKVHGSAFNIGEWSKKTETEAIQALKILSSPDRKRIEKQPFEGRRIEKTGDNEWLILNGQYYQDLMVEMNERSRKRRWAAEKRAQEKAEKKALKYADKHGAL